jgi:hypothetical protein
MRILLFAVGKPAPGYVPPNRKPSGPVVRFPEPPKK